MTGEQIESIEARPEADRTTLFAFVVMVVGVGGNVVAIKYIARAGELDPLWAAAMRFMIAATIFAVVARAVHAPWPRGRALVGAILYGAIGFGGFFGFIYWGLQNAPAGVSGVLLATGPLLTFLFALAHRLETFRWDRLLGSAIVVGGTAVIVRGGLDEGIPLTSLLAILGGAACGAEAAIVVKAFPPVHPAAMNAIGMGVGTAILLTLMTAFGESFVFPRGGTTWAGQAYLVIIGSVAVFALYLFVLSRWTASATSYEFVLIPIVGVVLSAWLLDERITGSFGVGALLVLAGVYLGALRPSASEARKSS